ncbi:hypothetical protein GCM10009789_18240 [Kribbella sancticallisti]|uniref:DUF2568 domain-containing protein n=1 Tax=Kribbella sancticallisti TaxID=460087 RepID=A0ABN2CVC6_9ACTN
MFEVWRWSNLGLAFLLELAGLAIFAWWGWRTGNSTAISLLLAIGLPVLAATIWGLFAAPTANYGSPAVTATVKLTFLALAALALWSLDHRLLAATFVLVVAANVVVIRTGNLTPDTQALTSKFPS